MFIRIFSAICLFLLSVYNICFAQQPKLVLPVGHSKPIISATFSPDSKKVLTLSADGTAKLWDAATGNLLKDFVAGGDASIVFVSMANFSPDGQHIIIGYESSTSAIWGLNSGKFIWDWMYNGHDATVTNILDHFSPNGKRIVLFNDTVYNVSTQKPLLTLKNNKAKPHLACYSKDGMKIATAASDSMVIIYDAHSGKSLVKRKFRSTYIDAIRFSPDNKSLYIFSRNGFTAKNKTNVQVIDATTGKITLQTVYYPMDNFGLFGQQTNDLFEQFSPQADAWFSYSESPPDDSTFSETYPDTAFVWQTKSGAFLYDVPDLAKHSNPVFFTDDGKKLVAMTNNNTVVIRHATTGSIQLKLIGHTAMINVVRFSPDEKKIVTASLDSTVRIWDAANGKLMTVLKGHAGALTEVRFSPDGTKIVTGSADKTAAVWDMNTGNLLTALKGHLRPIDFAKFSVDGKKIVVLSENRQQCWNFNNAVVSNELPDHQFEKINKDNGQIVSSDSDIGVNWGGNVVNIFSLKENASFPDIAFGMDETIKDLQLSPDNRQVLILTKNNGIRLYDIQQRAFTGTFLFLDSTDFILQAPSGYYQSTPNAAKLLHYTTSDLQVISFEQLDVKYNRPDKVLETIGRADTNAISMYRNAYFKRIKKLGIDTTAFRDGYSVPKADFVNRNSISALQQSDKLLLRIKAIDSSYTLDRFNIWVNEVPVFGQRGINIRKSNSNSFDQTITITLSQGENRIETSVTNVNGTESYRMPLIVKYAPAIKQKESTYFIGIGIDKFADANYNLQYSTKDIRDLAVKLKEKYGNNIIIDTLFNENVTIGNVKALKQKLLQTTVNDKVIISYSGHGLLSKTYDYYLSTYSVKFDNPQENGLPYDELENLLDSIPARKKLMLIDACHSGEVDKEEYRQAEINKSALDSNHVVSKGVIVTSTEDASKKLGLKNSFELMQNLFVNVGKSTGATIISAAAGTEFAMEFGNLKNGVFTYCIMEAMNKYPSMKISELKKTVGARVEELTKGMQKPTSRNEAIAVDWNIW